jgi:uncharacterized protein
MTVVQEANIHIVQTALDNARAGKLDLARPFFSDDFILYEAEGLPFGGDYRGWEGYKQVLDKLNQFWSPDRKQSFRHFIPYGDNKVIIHFELDGHINKNGRHVRMPVVAIWELKDGKVTRIRPFFFDTKLIADLATLGPAS